MVFHFLWGFVRFFAICGLLNRWFGTVWWPGAIAAGLLADIPIVGTIFAVWGGIVHYGLSWYSSAFVFAPDATIALTILPIMLVVAVIRTVPRPWRNWIIVALVGGAAVAVWAWHPWRAPEMRQIAAYRSGGTEYAIRADARGDGIEIDCPSMICDYDRDNPPDGFAIGEAELGQATIILDNALAVDRFCSWLSRMQQWATSSVESVGTHDDYIQIRARLDRHGTQRIWMGAQYLRGTGPKNHTIILLVAIFRPRGADQNRQAQIMVVLVDPPADATSSPTAIIHAIESATTLRARN